MIDTPDKNMQEGMNPGSSIQMSAGTPQGGGQSGQASGASRQVYESAAGRAREVESRIKNLGSEVKERAEHAKETLNQAYQRASHGMSEGWDHAMDYSRTHPAKATLIAFGAGIGIGLLLSGNLHSRNRARRLVPPVLNALSEIAREVFR
jgi:hypothetical protein